MLPIHWTTRLQLIALTAFWVSSLMYGCREPSIAVTEVLADGSNVTRWRMTFKPTEIPVDTCLCIVLQTPDGERSVCETWTFIRDAVSKHPELYKDCIVELRHNQGGITLLVLTSKGDTLGGGSCGPSPGVAQAVVTPGGTIEVNQTFCKFNPINRTSEAPAEIGMRIAFRPPETGN